MYRNASSTRIPRRAARLSRLDPGLTLSSSLILYRLRYLRLIVAHISSSYACILTVLIVISIAGRRFLSQDEAEELRRFRLLAGLFLSCQVAAIYDSHSWLISRETHYSTKYAAMLGRFDMMKGRPLQRTVNSSESFLGVVSGGALTYLVQGTKIVMLQQKTYPYLSSRRDC